MNKLLMTTLLSSTFCLSAFGIGYVPVTENQTNMYPAKSSNSSSSFKKAATSSNSPTCGADRTKTIQVIVNVVKRSDGTGNEAITRETLASIVDQAQYTVTDTDANGNPVCAVRWELFDVYELKSDKYWNKKTCDLYFSFAKKDAQDGYLNVYVPNPNGHDDSIGQYYGCTEVLNYDPNPTTVLTMGAGSLGRVAGDLSWELGHNAGNGMGICSKDQILRYADILASAQLSSGGASSSHGRNLKAKKNKR